MLPEINKYLQDILEACAELEAFTQNVSLEEYTADGMRRAAVERKLEIVGEALSQARKVDPTIEQAISEYRRIIAFRNILVHGYAAIDHTTVWGILRKDLPVLKRKVELLLASQTNS
jgi:uncharacterized protein with HEPN domain